MAGIIYDSSEMSRIQDLLNKQEKQMVDIDKEKKNTDSNVLRYAIIGGASILIKESKEMLTI